MFSRGLTFFVPLIVAIFLSVPAFAEEKPSKNKAQSELQRIQEQLKGVKKKEKEAAKKERSVLSELEAMDRSLNQKRAEVKKLENRLGAVSAEIDRTGADMDEYQAKLLRKEADLGARLRAMYKTERAGGPWVLLVSGDYASILKRYKYLAVLSERDSRMIKSYEGDLAQLSRYTERLKEQRADYDRVKKQRDAEAVRVLAQEEEKKRLLTAVRKKKGLYEAMARELEESSRRMKELIRRLEEEKKTQEKKTYAKPSVPQPPKFRLPSGSLDWPVNGRIISAFGRQKHAEYDTYIFKNGIEIQAPLGSAVHAIEGAEVAFANWFKGLGLVAILRHDGDLYSVYAHLADLKVKAGDRVSRGQVIATLGDTGAPSGASLYFEIRKGPEAQDPLRWLKRR